MNLNVTEVKGQVAIPSSFERIQEIGSALYPALGHSNEIVRIELIESRYVRSHLGAEHLFVQFQDLLLQGSAFSGVGLREGCCRPRFLAERRAPNHHQTAENDRK